MCLRMKASKSQSKPRLCYSKRINWSAENGNTKISSPQPLGDCYDWVSSCDCCYIGCWKKNRTIPETSIKISDVKGKIKRESNLPKSNVSFVIHCIEILWRFDLALVSVKPKLYSNLWVTYHFRTKKRCDENTVILSNRLDIRLPWRSDPKCAHHSIR